MYHRYLGRDEQDPLKPEDKGELLEAGHGMTDVSCRHGTRWLWWNPDPEKSEGEWKDVVRRCDCDCTDPPAPFLKPIVFEMIVPQEIKLTKKQLADCLGDLGCVGVSEQKIEQTPNGFLLTFNHKEWMDSWKSVGQPLKEGEEAKAFEEELKDSWLSDFEGYERIKINIKKECVVEIP